MTNYGSLLLCLGQGQNTGHVSRDVDRPVWGKFYLPLDVRQVLAGLSSLLQWLTGDLDLGLGR